MIKAGSALKIKQFGSIIKRKDEQEPGGKLEAQEQGGMPVIEEEGD